MAFLNDSGFAFPRYQSQMNKVAMALGEIFLEPMGALLRMHCEKLAPAIIIRQLHGRRFDDCLHTNHHIKAAASVKPLSSRSNVMGTTVKGAILFPLRISRGPSENTLPVVRSDFHRAENPSFMRL